jgi:hypothetical protein
VGNIPNISTKDEDFLIEDTNFGVKQLTNGKVKDIEGFPHIHKLFNLAFKQGFPKP